MPLPLSFTSSCGAEISRARELVCRARITTFAMPGDNSANVPPVLSIGVSAPDTGSKLLIPNELNARILLLPDPPNLLMSTPNEKLSVVSSVTMVHSICTCGRRSSSRLIRS